MHRRNSANPRRLDRRKSNTSVKSVHLEHILPETAERDAQVAATQAFARARARSATDSNAPLWPPPRPSCPGSNTPSYSPSPKGTLDEAPLGRQRSIRFVQQRPAHLAPNSTMAKDASSSCTSAAPRHHVAHAEVDPRPSISASASGMVSATKGAAGDYINTLFTSDEYYTPEDDIASMPSSYRRLRKSRSMFTNRVTVAAPENHNLSKSSASANQLPLPSNSYFRTSRGDENVPPRRLKTPKSMSFLRDFRDSFVPAFRSEDESIPFTPMTNSDRTKRHLRPKSSRFFRSRASSQERAFRKSMRDTSNSTVSITGEFAKDSSLRYKARRVSQGVKHKLKNLFGLGKGDNGNTKLPLQHIDAQRSHIFGLGDLQNNTDDELRHVSSVDQAALSHVASGIPSLHAVPSHQQLRSRQGSIESLQSEQKASDERSRVTSWSNSDTNTVITHNSYREDRERKRLSIINENGTHVCSSSAKFATISEQSNPSTASLHQPVQAPSATADGRRIYSALMKRIDQSQQAQTNLERQRNTEDIVHLGTVPRRRSSLRLGCDAAATIRYVMPESDSDSESPKPSERCSMKDKQSSPSASILKPSLPTTNRTRKQIQDHSEFVHMNTDLRDLKDIDNDMHSAPSIEAPPVVQTLSSRSSAFFGSPTRHMFRTQSPFRRALQDRMHTASNDAAVRSPGFNPWMRSLSNLPNIPLRRSSTYGSDADIKLHYTESIYSTNTEDGQTRRHSVLSVVEDLPRPTSTHGDATILANTSGYNKRSSSLPPKQRVSSSSSSVEWKMWLSSNVSKLEETTTQVDSNDFPYSLTSARSSGHVRENAQINDEGEDEVSNPPDTPSQAQGNRDSFMDLDHYDDDDDDYEDDQPKPFDAGDKYTTPSHSQLANPLACNASASSMASPVTYPGRTTPNAATGGFGVNREKALPKVPSLSFKVNKSKGPANITTKLVKRQLKPNNDMTPLMSRSHSSVGEDKIRKSNSLTNSRQKMFGMTNKKLENVSPAAVSDDDPYGIEGAGVLGPNQPNVGSKRIVDIFLSSRRRRMASDEEGSVFL
ncbi:hypothetical protein GGS24DRAFT_509399 [Hypoxylon argillaceum]|nr:hypothetical protein GGS24DRAFT_509399 [Hypoxylon argillaceum]